MHQCNRKSIRLKGYDYSQPGWFFLTICTQNRQPIFGDIIDEEMALNEFGKIMKSEWEKTEAIRNNIEIDQYIIMPNHLHGIIGIVDEPDPDVRANCNSPQRDKSQSSTFKSPSKTIGAIIRGFKSSVTKQINQIRNTPGAPL